MTEPILGETVDDLRRDRTSAKWRAYDADVLPLWIAEMDCTPCPAVVDAVTAAMKRGDTGYAASRCYAEAFAQFAASQWDWHVDPHTTPRVSDVLGGVARLLELVTDPGGPVVVSSPVYNAFFTVIDAVGRTAVDAPLSDDGRLDPAILAETFVRVTRGGQRAAYLLSNPHNPTGVVHSPDELATLARLADEHGVQVISDEIHAPLVYSTSSFTPYLTVPGSAAGITVTSASKAWNLAGLKAALIVPGDAARDVVRRLHHFVTFGASHLGVIAHAAAWTDGVDWLHQLVTELDSNRHLLKQLVGERLPGVRLLVPESTYLAWLDFRAVDPDLGLGPDPADTILRRARVALSEGPSFGEMGRGHARINIATSPAILREAIDRIASSLG